MNRIFENSFKQLQGYCEAEAYKGWDPYDGLTSRLFQHLPFISKNRFCRLAWIQLFKRNPVNLRPLVFIRKQYNAKGLGLFLTGYCNLYKAETNTELSNKIHFLANKIIELQCTGYSGSCWGYYFDWQARAFFQPAGTPTVVATSFVADALFNAFEITGETKYRDTALSAANFVLKDLNRTYNDKGNFSFSYSPLDHTTVFNASLLGAKLLSRAYYYTQNEALKLTAQKAVQFSCDHQQENGAWSYGTLPYHAWIDSFHTGFNLECIHAYQQYTGDTLFSPNIDKGLRYYTDTFFTEEGISKYYHNSLYPVDIHAPAQLVVTLAKLEQLEQHRVLAEKVLQWTIAHMQDKDGYFYYQKKRYFSSRIPYMRWAQAWMFYAFSYFKAAH